jgi:RNase adaptor protein for sRNA GlmZ degradation
MYMFEGFIATYFGSCAKVHHEASKILNESYYVKHLILFYTASQAPYINRYKNTKRNFCNDSIYFYQEYMKNVQ